MSVIRFLLPVLVLLSNPASAQIVLAGFQRGSIAPPRRGVRGPIREFGRPGTSLTYPMRLTRDATWGVAISMTQISRAEASSS